MHTNTADVDAAVDQIINKLQGQWIRIAGCRQRVVPGGSEGCGIRLQSIASGQFHSVTKNPGTGSASCNLDPEALDQVALTIMQELDSTLDLVVVNRYGKREAEGAGFCCVIERAIELGLPVLAIVNEKWMDSWINSGGECAKTLPVNLVDIESWCNSVVDNRKPLPITA